jgi:hypothetical protein
MLLENLIGHPWGGCLLEEITFMKIIAVGTVQITSRTDWLDHRMETVSIAFRLRRQNQFWLEMVDHFMVPFPAFLSAVAIDLFSL